MEISPYTRSEVVMISQLSASYEKEIKIIESKVSERYVRK
jgi:hypothetical protein